MMAFCSDIQVHYVGKRQNFCMLNPAVLEVTTGLERVVTIILHNFSSPLVCEFRVNTSVKTWLMIFVSLSVCRLRLFN